MAVTLSPFGNGFQFFSDSGVPLSDGLLWTYVAGTTTPILTYTNSAGSIANANPIVLDSAGRPPSEIWLTVGSAYKFVLLDAASSPVGPTLDNIVGVQDFNNITATGNTVLGTTGNSLNVSNGALVVSSGNTAVGGDLTIAGNTTIGDGATDVLTVNADTIDLVNNPTITGTATWASNQTFAAATFSANPTGRVEGDTYTPTFTAGTNVSSASNGGGWKWTRTGNIVHVAGRVNVTCAAAANTHSEVGISLPIASNTGGSDITGVANIALLSGQSGGYVGDDSTNHRAVLAFASGATGANVWFVVFTYEVI